MGAWYLLFAKIFEKLRDITHLFPKADSKYYCCNHVIHYFLSKKVNINNLIDVAFLF